MRRLEGGEVGADAWRLERELLVPVAESAESIDQEQGGKEGCCVLSAFWRSIIKTKLIASCWLQSFTTELNSSAERMNLCPPTGEDVV